MFDLGMQELIVIFLVAFLVFGPKKLPELARTIGKGLREIRSALSNVKDTLKETDMDITKEIRDARTGIRDTLRKVVEPEITPEAPTENKPGNSAAQKEAASGTEKDG